MAKTGGHKHRQIFSDINITPLTDIFLVLLTIMMVVAPLMRQMRQDVHLPEIVAGAKVEKDQISVDVNVAGQYFMNGVEIPVDRLAEVLRQKGESMLVKKLSVQADRDAKSGAVLKVFDAAEQAGYALMTVVGQSAAAQPEKQPDENRSPATVQ